jgi:hypothetical protein
VEEKPYTAQLSLRLSHEALDLTSICDALEMQPRVIWKAGDRNVTPAGTPIEGTRNNSYCSIDLFPASDRPLHRQVDEALALLERHAATLQGFHRDGGKVDLCIGWFCIADTGTTLDASVVERLARIKTGLDMHVYVPDPVGSTDLQE